MSLFCEKGSFIDNRQGPEYALGTKFFRVFFSGTTVTNNLYWYSLTSSSNVYVEVFMKEKHSQQQQNNTQKTPHCFDKSFLCIFTIIFEQILPFLLMYFYSSTWALFWRYVLCLRKSVEISKSEEALAQIFILLKTRHGFPLLCRIPGLLA